MSGKSFSIAGILVRTQPDNLRTVMAALSALPGVEVHHHEAATGRVVVTCEAGTDSGQREGLERIRGQANVLGADPVYHYTAPPERPGDPGVTPAPGGRS